MKYKNILRLLGIIAILSILMAVIPAAPALAANDVVLSPASGKIGDSITITGSNFSPSSDTTEKHARIIFSSIAASVGGTIGTTVTTYKVMSSPYISASTDDVPGYFQTTFIVPSVLDSGSVTGTVVPGTYYIYVTLEYITGPLATIISATPFTITATAALSPLSVTSGPVGTSLTVSGSNFLPSYPVIINLDTTTISSNTNTNTSGSFSSTISIPSGTILGAHTISVTVGTTTLTTTFTVTASPTLTLSATSGSAGSDITITGANFAVSSPIEFKFGSTTPTTKSGSITGSTGAINSVITIPSSAAVGEYVISVKVGTTTVNKVFNVTSATPPTTTPPTSTPPTTTPPTTTPPSSKTTLNVVQNAYSVGSPVGIGGAGFTPGANVTIKYEDKVIASTKVTTDRTFQVIFNIPPAQHGVRQFTISDGTNTATANFTVESVAPKVPPPLKPQSGAKVKSPVLFDWEAVTDESMPVTYHLQVATDRSFGASMLVLDRTGLDSTSYTLTEAEELKLAGKDTAYYWRVKSIDAASNESDWTGAGEFSIPGPFKFPTWALYTSLTFGAIVIFLLGLWVGRRTAFYY